MIDEIYLAKRVEASGGQLFGLTDNCQVETIGLWFMIKSFSSLYQDMIAIHFVRSLKAETLKKCFDKIMLLLHEVDFNVIEICVDNAAAHRKFYKEFLCGGCWQSSIKNSFSGGKIFLLFDPTHIVKNIYNNFLTKKVFKIPMLSPILSQNLTAKLSDVKNVYDLDIDLERHKPLRIAHKLTETVLNPKRIKKVNLKLAMSFLHESTRIALKQYGFVETATALKFFAKFWNIINVSSPTTGKHKRDIFCDPVKCPDDWKLDYFLELEKYLTFWENSKISSKRKQLITIKKFLENFFLIYAYILL